MGVGKLAGMRPLSFLFLLFLGSWAGAEPGWVSQVRYEQGALQVLMINYEVPRDKPYLIVHYEIRNPSAEEQRCDWQSLVSLKRPDGETMSPNYDVMVDTGTGGARATGPFPIPKGGKARLSVLFVLSADDLPGHLLLPDGRESARIVFRGKPRW